MPLVFFVLYVFVITDHSVYPIGFRDWKTRILNSIRVLEVCKFGSIS